MRNHDKEAEKKNKSDAKIGTTISFVHIILFEMVNSPVFFFAKFNPHTVLERNETQKLKKKKKIQIPMPHRRQQQLQ